MIDHNYKITTREILRPSSSDQCFVTELSHVTFVKDGKTIALNYPTIKFFGKTQTEAIAQATEIVRDWIKHVQFLPISSFEVYDVIPA